MQLDLFTSTTTTDTKNTTTTTESAMKDVVGTKTDSKEKDKKTEQKSRLPEITDSNTLIDRIQYYYEQYPVYTAIAFITHIAVCIIAAMLALECNQYESALIKFAVVVIAFIFGEIYIIYYALYHIVAGVKCYLPQSEYGNISKYSVLAKTD